MKTVKTKSAAEETRRNFFARAAKKFNEKRRKIMLAATTAYAMSFTTVISAFASGATGAIQDDVDADAAFVSVIDFFAKWIGRVGLVIAFVGAIQFALGIKSEDAEGKSRGLMVLVAGFIVFAVTKSLNLFGFNTGIV